MESALLGLVLDFSILITAERRKITPKKAEIIARIGASKPPEE